MMYYVYIHKLPNGKVYVGATFRKPKYRWSKGNGYKYNKEFYNDILKYGWDNIKHIIVSKNLSKEDARKKEMELISFFNANNPKYGYNKSHGGEVKGDTSLITRLKISKSLNKREKNNNYIISIKEQRHRKGKPVICIETKMIFQRIKDASIYYKICDETIRKCCNKKRFTAGGYHWEFYKESDNKC